MRNRSTKGRRILSGSLALALAAACTDDPKIPKNTKKSPEDFASSAIQERSCMLDCASACSETEKPWQCASLGEWSAIPHAASCGDFDGKTFPAVTPGKCVASDPSGDALSKASITATPMILPDGRRLRPEGTEWLFSEAGFDGGFPASTLLVPGTRFLIVNDNGYKAHSLRVIDTALLRAGGATTPIVSLAKYPAPEALNYGMAYVAATKTLYAGSGGKVDSIIRAFDFDESTGALTPNPAKVVKLPKEMQPQGLDVSPDGKRLLVGQAQPYSDADYLHKVIVYSLEAADYGKELATIDLGRSDVFAVRFDPTDASGSTAYATLWVGVDKINDPNHMRLVQINVAAKTSKNIVVGKTPEEIAFLDPRYMVVATAQSDSLTIVDRVAGTVVKEIKMAGTGYGPSALAFDAARKRLYVALSGMNGIGVFDVTATADVPDVVQAGTFATSWWPTGIAIDPADGTVFVTNGKGHGSGPGDHALDFGEGEVATKIRGSVAAVPYPTGAALAEMTARFESYNHVAKLSGYSTVACNGAPYDFPIPDKIESGPSDKIKHVFFVVRENKCFDGIFGDLPGVDGDPKLMLSPSHMDEIWGNARTIAKTFAHMDNYYLDAEQSIQGHAWTVFGRTTDYTERRWLTTWGRGEYLVTRVAPGVGDETSPLEGTLFSSLASSGVTVDQMGELIGGFANRNSEWPAGTTNATIPDTIGSCYMGNRLRVLCDPKDFSYLWLGNDHTFGLASGKPNPAIMIAVNDEATGMLLDAISHSPYWKDSLFVVVEDDPNGGSDHVDLHRTIALFASPWIKRGYVSHAHYDMASIHKLFSHVYGKPYRNSVIADAALPLDLFTSTPDYTPFTYKPLGYKDRSCNPEGTVGAEAARKWNFSSPDEQPGLDEQVADALRVIGGAKPYDRDDEAEEHAAMNGATGSARRGVASKTGSTGGVAKGGKPPVDDDD